MSAPPQMKGLVAVLANVTEEALLEAFRHVALKVMGRATSIDAVRAFPNHFLDVWGKILMYVSLRAWP